MGLTLEVKPKDLENTESVQIEDYLKTNSKNFYTVRGIMVKVFKVPEKALNVALKDMSDKHNKLLGRTRYILMKLLENEKVIKKDYYGNKRMDLFQWKK